MNHKECPIVLTLEVIGGKWKPIILHYLSEAPRRTGELGRLIPQASGKMLTQQLRELEADKIIRRKVYRQVPPKVEYILTPLGESLRPVMVAMCAWGETYAHRENGKGSLHGLSSLVALEKKTFSRTSSRKPSLS
jgi:DNA-binding HxlR family transcriptional regulator